jgi:hypothetical protein
VGIRPRVLPDTRDLPGYANAGLVGLDLEATAGHLLGHDSLGEFSYRRQLVAEVSVERLKVASSDLSMAAPEDWRVD